MRLPHLVLLATGGTIAGQSTQPTDTIGYVSGQIDVQDLVHQVPGLSQLAHLQAEQFCQIGSEDMTPALWLSLSRQIASLLEQPNVDGVVILHGTDTLEETAYFLHLTVKSTKPIVLTGAMRPATALSADGPMNLYQAVQVAADRRSVGKGVLVVMENYIFDARSVTKLATHAPSAFLGLQGSIGFLNGPQVYYTSKPTRLHTQQSSFDIRGLQALPPVCILYQYAGSEDAFWAQACASYSGIVLACVGNGSLNAVMQKALGALSDSPVIVRSSRSPFGGVPHDGEISDRHLHTIAAGDLSPQKARILLQLCLTQTKDLQEIQAFFDQY